MAAWLLRSTPALTRRMNPLDCVKSKSPWNRLRPAGMWTVMLPTLMSPSWNVSASRLGSSGTVMRTSCVSVAADGAFWKLTVNGSGWLTGTKPPVSTVYGPVMDAAPAPKPALA